MNVSQFSVDSSYDRGSSKRGRLVSKGGFRVGEFIASVLTYCIFIVLFFLLKEIASDDIRLAILHLGAATSLFVYWKLGRWGKARFDSFGPALLLIQAMLRIQAAIDVLVYGLRLDELPSTVPFPQALMELFFKGEAITHFGILLAVFGWKTLIAEKIGSFSFLNNHYSVPKKLPQIIYGLALLIEIGKRIYFFNFGDMTQISFLTYGFGVVSIYFIAARQKTISLRILIAVILALPLAILALGTGMKENIVFPLVPAVILYWFGYKGLPSKAFAVLSGIVVLALAQLYVGYVRDASWGSHREYTISELISGFQDHLSKTNLRTGLDAISSRINMTSSHAITVAITDRYGTEPFGVFGSIPMTFIPRVFWPNKPIFQPGAMHTVRIQNIRGPLSEVSTSTAAGFFTELYLGGGYTGCIVGAILFGVLLAIAQIWSLKHVTGFGNLAFSFVSVYWALRFDENHVVYAYTSVIFTTVFLFMLVKASAFLGFGKRISKDLVVPGKFSPDN